VRDNHIDGDLVRIFMEAQVWACLGTPGAPSRRP
jgi:hypothetical protein